MCWSGSRGGHEDDPRAGERILRGQAEGAGAAQPGGGSRVTLEQLPVPEGAYRKDGEGLFTRGCSDRTGQGGMALN